MTTPDPTDARARVGSYIEFAPPRGCEAFVECLWTHAVRADFDDWGGRWHRVLPDDAVSLAFWCRRDAGGRVQEGHFSVIGPVRVPHLFTFVPGQELVAVKLRPEWLPAVLDTFAGEHVDGVSDGAPLLPRVLSGAEDSLTTTVHWRDALAALWMIVLESARRRAGFASPNAGQRAIAALRAAPARTPITWTAQQLGLSSRHLHRLVVDAAGSAPKELCRTWRFLRVLEIADRTDRPNWAALAADAGYADQAHLSNEFRLLTGLSPERLMAERRNESAVCPTPA
jgi:AraC-like DNA-binding protein